MEGEARNLYFTVVKSGTNSVGFAISVHHPLFDDPIINAEPKLYTLSEVSAFQLKAKNIQAPILSENEIEAQEQMTQYLKLIKGEL